MGAGGFTESIVEEAALARLGAVGWQILHGPEIAFGQPAAERSDPGYRDVVLLARLRSALERLNPGLPSDARDDALRRLTQPAGATLMERNRAVHRHLVDGITVEYRRPDGSIAGALASVIDFAYPESNEFIAVNQFTVVEAGHERRPDIVLFVNGLPLAAIELKNSADEKATIHSAYKQLQTYQKQIPTLFESNGLLVTSDGTSARVGMLGSGQEWFKPWRTIDGAEKAPASWSEQRVLIDGVLAPHRLVDLVRHFIVFEDMGGGSISKKFAGYHQYHAVNAAVEETLRATGALGIAELKAAEERAPYGVEDRRGGNTGDRRVGVIWHTQGSGKSLTMLYYTGRIILEPAMANPTIVVLTDRNDLDDQLFGTFSRCRDLLRQDPVQAEDRADLRAKLSVGGGGVVFTTIQKFMPDERGDHHPVLSARRNIVVIADEAHRSQYDFIDGYARHLRDALPGASFVGFTGTPIELTDANTRAVFGDYISVYDIARAVEDGATVRIFYESRLAKLALSDRERPMIDPTFEEVTEGEEEARKERLKSKWAQLEALVGSERRLKLIAADLVRHYEERVDAMAGKAMVVTMSRRIAVDLYNEIAALRPDWVGESDEDGALKVVMTGSASDPLEWQDHIRNKARREALAARFRDPSDPFRMVIVRDMWLTGFDAPSLHTMYLDKPMRGHGLMQAIARVNRVFRDKPGGLVVDYLGIADELRQALATYTQAGGSGKTAIDQSEAVALMLEKYEVCQGLFHGFDHSAWADGTAEERLDLLPAAQEHILAQEDGKQRLLQVVSDLSAAFALSVPADEALTIRDDVGFFQAVRAVLAKSDVSKQRTPDEVEHAIRQIVSSAIVSDEVVDVFAAAGLKKPDISILSDEFLAEVKDLPQKNVAVELLQKLLKGEIRSRSKHNVVQARSFADLLEQALRRYQNRAIETAQVIEQLIEIAKDLRKASTRGEQLGLSEDELAFYDALGTNDSAVAIMGDEALLAIARELTEKVRANVTIDWTVRETARAQLKVLVKRILRVHKYPPDKQEKATETVLEQAEALSEMWAVA